MVNFRQQEDTSFCLINLKRCRTFSLTEFLSLNRCARTLPNPPLLHCSLSHTSFISFPPLKSELCNPRSFITPWQPWAKWSMTETRGKNGAKEQTLIQPMGKLLHMAHTSLQHGATGMCNSKGHSRRGWYLRQGFYFLLKKGLSTAERISSFFFFPAWVGIFAFFASLVKDRFAIVPLHL